MIQVCHSSLRSSLLRLTSSTDFAADFTRVYSLDVCLFDNFHFPYFHAYTPGGRGFWIAIARQKLPDNMFLGVVDDLGFKAGNRRW